MLLLLLHIFIAINIGYRRFCDMRKQRSPVKYEPRQTMLLASLLANLQLKRKSYCLQLLKQFILFPDESDSSQKTVSKYDGLIFSDEQIHTMFKKIQTKLIENKIWAFINLKAHRYVLAVKKLEHPIRKIHQRAQRQQKQFTFIQIKTYYELQINRGKITAQTQTTTNIHQMPVTQITTPVKQVVSPVKQVVSPKKTQGSSTRIEINVDIRHQTRMNISPAKMHQNSPQRSQIYQYKGVSYPISQLHPQQPSQSLHPSQPRQAADTHRQNRLINEQPSVARDRSRSGSIIRYEYDLNGAKKIIVNGQEVPVHVKMQRSESPMQEPQYTVRDGGRAEDPRYSFGGITRAELQKRENLKYQYQNSNAQHRNAQTKKNTVIYRQQEGENCPACSGCGQRHSSDVSCGKRSHKVIRLRSNSKREANAGAGGYVSHLHN